MQETYDIPESVSIAEIDEFLARFQRVKSSQRFEYAVSGRKLTFSACSNNCNLVQYKEQSKLFSLFEAYHILNKCIHAGFEAAKEGIFIGGYQMGDFSIEPHRKDIKVHLLVRPDRLIDVLSKKYAPCAAPEVRESGLLTEKADFWSYGVMFYNLLKTEKPLFKDENDHFTQLSFLLQLQIQNQQLVENLVRFIDQDHETRVGYSQFMRQIQVKCSQRQVKELRTYSNQDSFDQILRIRGLREIRQIGQGSFGRVILVENKQRGQLAMKIIEIHSQEDMNKSSSEAWFMFCNRHSRFIVDIVDVQKVVVRNQIYIMVLQEYAQLGDLRQFMRTYRVQLGQKQVMRLFYDVANALQLMKSENMIHRDIKPENILIVQSEDGSVTAKLADFGCDELIVNQSGSDSFVGTPGYMAPEVFCGGYVSFPVDIWAFGIMLQEYTEERGLVEQCLVDDPRQRITIEQVLSQLEQYRDATVYVEKIIFEAEETTNPSVTESSIEYIGDQFTFSEFQVIK